MGHFKKKKIKRFNRTLRIIPGGKQVDATLEKLALSAWIFAHTTLWNCTKFSTKEQVAAQDKIKEFLRREKQPRQAFLAFCERVLLAKLSVVKGSDGLSLPSAWLDRGNAKGLAATRIAHQKVKTLRESLPLYKYEWKALAEAVLEFSEEPTASNFRYWADYFTEKQASGLLQLFQVYVANCHFTI